jgi:phosphoribosylglycinamide formyltransferase-1
MNSGYNKKISITIFASGGGTNARNIINYFSGHPTLFINYLITNKPGSGAVKIAQEFGIPVRVITKKDWEDIPHLVENFIAGGTDYIVLAGYLQLLNPSLVKAFSGRILNIHPALLPKFGGKGMYGKFVHQAVFNAGEKETGITIHEVNEQYDDGNIVFQKVIPITVHDTPETIEKKVRALEMQYYPQVIEQFIMQKQKI